MLIKAFLIAFGFSFFIYSEVFGLKNIYLNSVFALFSLFFILNADVKKSFWIGFFIGVLWFYWIGLSFRYYDLTWMIPFVILFVGLVYGIIFLLISVIGNWELEIRKKTNSKFLIPNSDISLVKPLIFLYLSYIHPFGFNWFIPELTLVNTIFSFDKPSFFLILMSLYLIGHWTLDIGHWKKTVLIVTTIALLLFSLKDKERKPKLPDLKIYLSETKIPQDIKWNPRYRQKIISINMALIEKAIKDGYDLVVLPESAFPLYLNLEVDLLNTLKEKSKKIAIVTGALHLKDNLSYNSAYIFKNKDYLIADKVVLVPFGEEIPLPKFLAKYINKIFFNGAEDYQKAKKPTDFKIKDITFRNAICYEATHPLLYKNAPKYMIAISNNAWFTPSIEPILQNLIIKYYARLHNMVVFHSCNIAKTGVIW